MRAAIALAGCFLISSSVFAGEPQLNDTAKMKPFVVALAKMPTQKAAAQKAAAHKVTTGAAIETRVAEGSLEKFGATGLPQ
jgi:hypothetical protein